MKTILAGLDILQIDKKEELAFEKAVIEANHHQCISYNSNAIQDTFRARDARQISAKQLEKLQEIIKALPVQIVRLCSDQFRKELRGFLRGKRGTYGRLPRSKISYSGRALANAYAWAWTGNYPTRKKIREWAKDLRKKGIKRVDFFVISGLPFEDSRYHETHFLMRAINSKKGTTWASVDAQFDSDNASYQVKENLKRLYDSNSRTSLRKVEAPDVSCCLNRSKFEKYEKQAKAKIFFPLLVLAYKKHRKNIKRLKLKAIWINSDLLK